jgi:hypothetical protein
MGEELGVLMAGEMVSSSESSRISIRDELIMTCGRQRRDLRLISNNALDFRAASTGVFEHEACSRLDLEANIEWTNSGSKQDVSSSVDDHY